MILGILLAINFSLFSVMNMATVTERQEPLVTGSLAWLHFTKKENGGVCNYCKKFIPIKGGNTSGLIRHIPVHKEANKEYLKKKK